MDPKGGTMKTERRCATCELTATTVRQMRDGEATVNVSLCPECSAAWDRLVTHRDVTLSLESLRVRAILDGRLNFRDRNRRD